MNSWGGAWIHDDIYEIRDNEDLSRLSFVFEVFGGRAWTAERGYGFTYRPVSWAAATIVRVLGGDSPVPFHVFNTLLHAIAVVLVILLVKSFLPPGEKATQTFVSAGTAAGLIFAAHPVHTEAVAWASGRSDVLSTTLLLGAWVLYQREGGFVRRGLGSASLFALALFAKETAAAALLLLPMGAFLKAYLAEPRIGPAIRQVPIRPLLAHAAAFLGYLLARTAAIGQLFRGGARGVQMLQPLEGAGLTERILTAAAIVPEQIRLLFWPARLSIEYSVDQIPIARSLADPRILPAFVLIPCGIAALWWWRPAWGRATAALILLYLAAWFPTSNIAVLPNTMFSERYLYLPSVVLCAGAGILLAGLARQGDSRRRTAVAIALAIVLIASASRTIARNHDWRDPEPLFRSSIEAAPRAARLYFNLGMALRNVERYGEAEAAYRKALEIVPSYADARAELGLCLIRAGRTEEAAAELSRAGADAPNDTIILSNLGGAYLMMGRTDEALPLLRRSVLVDPNNVEAWGNLGKAALDRGDAVEARRAFNAGLAADPNAAALHLGLGAALATSGDLAGAVASFRRALDLRPDDDDAAFNLARALLVTGDAASALKVAEPLARRHPGDPQVSALVDQIRSASVSR